MIALDDVFLLSAPPLWARRRVARGRAGERDADGVGQRPRQVGASPSAAQIGVADHFLDDLL
eukprot:1663232-Pyramimonas_sp.AAC.1